MPIRIDCACGRTVTVKDELAGKLVKCPECKQPLRVPAGDDEVADADMLDEDNRPRERRPSAPAGMRTTTTTALRRRNARPAVTTRRTKMTTTTVRAARAVASSRSAVA